MKLPFTRAREGDEPQTPVDHEPSSTDSADSGVPPLSLWERRGIKLTALGGAGVGGLGFYASFDAVSAKALEWGFDEPWVLPTAIDSAIPVFTGAYLFLIRMDMRLWWARLVPWALSLITCALNVAAGTSLWSKVAHGAMSLLWVAVSEIAAHTYAVRIGAATGRRRRMDKVRWARWILAPLPTFLLWRRMKLWELTSYDTVLELEQGRLLYQAKLRARFGRAWRTKAPVESLMPLRLARTGIPLQETAADGLRAAGLELGIFAPPVAPVEELPALPTPVPAAAVPAASLKPRRITATVPSQPAKVLKPAPTPEEPTAAAAEEPGEPQPYVVPSWSTEGELREILVQVIDGKHRDVFDGPLTGAAIAEVLGQSEGNGRKVRGRIIKEYAAQRGVQIPPRATVDDVFAAFDQALTATGS
ncbi:Protein of unknown function [Streptomyces sp. 2131.1]|uniref:DUF2637 domain-containing protein n=1 Tax=Streptomyces sp. 2131.1 TaxID=1855346 RepID=UPI00089780C8|nr:DUF2637 domain-containing protein [Streptomyces sp. 2131.1]SEE83904.1 Protein of unknown function [Streptomyces sp. 2131.1]